MTSIVLFQRRYQIPKKVLNCTQVLNRLVLAHMIHGPCGNARQYLCMFREGRPANCTKKFAKPFNNVTEDGQGSFPRYKRRHPDARGRPIAVDNRWAYSPILLKAINCHLNAELSLSVKAIKYLLKYINKGSDRAVF